MTGIARRHLRAVGKTAACLPQPAWCRQTNVLQPNKIIGASTK